MENFVGLFDGAGGADLGIGRAGLKGLLAVENDPDCVQTLGLNFPDTTVCDADLSEVPVAEILKANGIGKSDAPLIFASPPCQGVSECGPKLGWDDERNQLMFVPVDAMRHCPKSHCVIENVPGLLKGDGISIYNELMRRIVALGRMPTTWILTATKFGLAQNRKRVFIICPPKGKKAPAPPSGFRTPALTLYDAIHPDTDFRDVDAAPVDFTEQEKFWYAGIPPGGDWRDSGPGRAYAFDLHRRRLKEGKDGDGMPRRRNLFRRMKWTEPSPTVVGSWPQLIGARSQYAHPTAERFLTNGECRVLQGFPSHHVFHGDDRSRRRQIGNAVPPVMAEQVIRAIMERRNDKIVVSLPDVQKKIDRPNLTRPARPNLAYYGGKWRIAPWIISHLPEHDVYVEPFAGAASVLMRKEPSRIEVVNDVDSEIVNLFRVLRNEKDAKELSRLVAMTPYSRQEYEEAYEPTDDPIERARRLVIRSDMGYGGLRPFKNGFRRSFGHEVMTEQWAGRPDAILKATERLKAVVVENLPALDCIQKYDNRRTLFYVDPPYMTETRNKGKIYSTELTDADHARLLKQLQAVQGRVVLSGYDSPLYRRELAGWQTERRKQQNLSHRIATESLWIRPAA